MDVRPVVGRCYIESALKEYETDERLQYKVQNKGPRTGASLFLSIFRHLKYKIQDVAF